MKLTLALLAATAIGAVVTIAAAATVGPFAGNTFSHVADKVAEVADRGATILASDDDEDHEYRKHRRTDDDGDKDDDDDGAGAASNPAPAGTVAPPVNGLFGDGPGPRVKVN
jgi:hypothetical protein